MLCLTHVLSVTLLAAICHARGLLKVPKFLGREVGDGNERFGQYSPIRQPCKTLSVILSRMPRETFEGHRKAATRSYSRSWSGDVTLLPPQADNAALIQFSLAA